MRQNILVRYDLTLYYRKAVAHVVVEDVQAWINFRNVSNVKQSFLAPWTSRRLTCVFAWTSRPWPNAVRASAVDSTITNKRNETLYTQGMPSSENYSRWVKTARSCLTIHGSFVRSLRCHFACPFRNIRPSKRRTSPDRHILFREWLQTLQLFFSLKMQQRWRTMWDIFFYCHTGFQCLYYIMIVRLFSFFKSDLFNGRAFKWGPWGKK